MDMDIGSSLRARAKKTYVELELAVDGYGYRFLFARPRKYDLHFISHPFFSSLFLPPVHSQNYHWAIYITSLL